MKAEDFLEGALNKSDKDYGLCPPPTTPDDGMRILIEHFLGPNWYVTMPVSSEQVYTEAIYKILQDNKKSKSFLKRLLR